VHSDRWFHAWRRVLLLGLFVQAAVGYLVAFAYPTPALAWHADGVARDLWGAPDYPDAVLAYRGFLMGVLGATIAGSALVTAWVVAVPFARRERWAWGCVATALLAWAPVDVGLSLAHGVVTNAVFDVVPIVMLAAPLIATGPALLRRPASAGAPAPDRCAQASLSS
jgi:hypothetical protein